MDAENNFPTNPFAASQRLGRALRRHYWRHLLAGALIWVVAGLASLAYENLSHGRAAFVLAWDDEPRTTDAVVGEWMFWAVLYVLCGLLPAAVAGAMRMPPLAWQCRRNGSRAALVGWSLLTFGASVVLAAVGYWWLTGGAHTRQSGQALAAALGTCFVASLPWLLGTAWASWQLAADLRMLPRDQTPPL